MERTVPRPVGTNYLSHGVAKIVCWIMGGVFVLVALLGFFSNDHYVMGVFMVNPVHNWVHLLSGIALIALGFAREDIARLGAWVFAIVYGVVTILGFMNFDPLVDLLHLNNADNWLHLLITAVFVIAALVSQSLTHGRLLPGMDMHGGHGGRPTMQGR